MKRKILMSLLAASLFIGCANKKQPIVEVPVVEKEEVVVPVQNVEKESKMIMKLLVVLSIKEYQEQVGSLLHDAGVKRFSVTNITGYK